MKTDFIYNSEDHVTELGAANGTKLLPKGSTIILVRGMTLHNYIPICFASNEITINQDVKGLLPKENIRPLYLYYLLKAHHNHLHQLVDSAGHGTGRLNSDQLLTFEVQVPSLEIQDKLLSTISPIDDRINLNTKINETLESITKTIFKEWFIDFGPVKAKIDGKKPKGMDEQTASLFPDGFEESELGMIPTGWKVSTYSNVMEHVKDGVNPESFGEVECIHYSLPNFDAGKNAKKEKVAEIKSNKFRVHHNTILFSKLNPRTPRVWIANHNESENKKAIGSTEFVVIHPTAPEHRWLIYCLLSESMFLDRMSQTATGTSNSHQRIKPESIFETKWATPSKEIIERFHKTTNNLFELYLSNLKEIQNLIQTRDLLLPKLISGELQLKEVLCD